VLLRGAAAEIAEEVVVARRELKVALKIDMNRVDLAQDCLKDAVHFVFRRTGRRTPRVGFPEFEPRLDGLAEATVDALGDVETEASVQLVAVLVAPPLESSAKNGRAVPAYRRISYKVERAWRRAEMLRSKFQGKRDVLRLELDLKRASVLWVVEIDERVH